MKRGLYVGCCRLFFLLLAGCLLAACRYCPPDYNDYTISKGERDSLLYLWQHHITINSNFEVMADSIILQERFLTKKFTILHRRDRIVLADFMLLPQDSIDSLWVKVAHDQTTMGWIRRNELLPQVVPVDPVSRFIHGFSARSGWLMQVAGVAALLLSLFAWFFRRRLRCVFYNDIDSLYPLLLCLLVATMAAVYVYMQTYVPADWVHFYYNPSLNPLLLPVPVSLFVLLFWSVLIVGIAVFEEVFRKMSFSDACSYLPVLAALCIVCYQLFMFMPFLYVGVPCLSFFWGYFIYRCCRLFSSTYQCGHCGRRISRKGVCPHCGVFNE